MARRWILPRGVGGARKGRSRWTGLFLVLWGVGIVGVLLAATLVQGASRRAITPLAAHVARHYVAGWPLTYTSWHEPPSRSGRWPPIAFFNWLALVGDILCLAVCLGLGLAVLVWLWRAVWRFGATVPAEQRASSLVQGLGGAAVWEYVALLLINGQPTLPAGLRLLAMPAVAQITVQGWFERAPGPTIQPDGPAAVVEWLVVLALAIGLPGALLTTVAIWATRLSSVRSTKPS